VISKLEPGCEVQIRCGGLHQRPQPPLGYMLLFAIEGLTNEYTGEAEILREGEILRVPTFEGYETLEFPAPVGRCEAFYTSGGTSTAPYTFRGRVRTFEYKTVRYPGHYSLMRAFKELGFLDDRPVRVGDCQVIPRELFHVLVEPRLTFPEERDVVVLRVTGRGFRQGRRWMVEYEMLDFYEERSGLSAMARTNGFAAAISAWMLAEGRIPPGVVPLEGAVDGELFLAELERRGIRVCHREGPMEEASG